MQKHFSFEFIHYVQANQTDWIEMISDLEGVAEIGDDDSVPGEWNVYGLYVCGPGTKRPVLIQPHTPMHTQALNALADLADEIDDEWSAYVADYGHSANDLGEGHLQHERL
jgi:hypothetical protein